MTGKPHAIEILGFLRHRVDDRIKDRYLVQELLGGGNFGSVYKVRDEAVGNVMACKEMHVLNDPTTPTSEREEALDLFKREALSLATLRHPNIPAAYFEQEDGEWHICPRCGLDFPDQQTCPDHGGELLTVTQRYYLMMDFIDGPTLEDLVEQHIEKEGSPPPEEQVLQWILQVGSAVSSLHRVGIVHRDIKPDNIKIRSGDGAAMLLDFGLTKKVGEASGYGTAPMTGTTRFGTPGYAPPNPKECENPERRSDIYALGMTLYRALSGRDPQNSKNLREMKDFSPRHFNTSISHDTERLIALSTTAEPRNRYQSMEDFLSDLKAIHDPGGQSWKAPPFTFADGSKAHNVAELARQIDRHSQESINYLFNGMLHTWLQQNGLAAPAQSAEEVAKKFATLPRRALEIFRRSLYPSHAKDILPRLEAQPAQLNFPSIVSGTQTTLKLRLRNIGAGLAWGEIECRSERAQVPVGIEFPAQFENNDSLIEVTLNAKKMSLGKGDCTLRVVWNGGELDVPISYEVTPLELELQPQTLDFGNVSLQEKSSRLLHLKRKSTFDSGSPQGTIYVAGTLRGLQAPDRFAGEENGEAQIELTVDAGATDVMARHYSGFVQLDTNGGRWRIPVRYTIALPIGKVLSILFSAIIIGAAGAAIARLAYIIVNPQYAIRWLVETNGNGLLSSAPFEGNTTALLIIGALIGLMAATLLSLKEGSRKLPRSLRDIFPIIGAMLGAPLGFAGGYVLHFVFWWFGDWLLWPLNNWLHISPNPLWIWGGVGACVGAIVGITQLLHLRGQDWARYAMWGLFSLLFLFLLLSAMLA
ncbi:MAG: serine/threonine-protein kinase [Abditibacteriaceae bacterium]